MKGYLDVFCVKCNSRDVRWVDVPDTFREIRKEKIENIIKELKSKFICQRCGRCCRYNVYLIDEEEIMEIERSGYRREEFLENSMIKLLDGKCYFLKKNKDGNFFCRIYKSRPKACKEFPFSKIRKGVIEVFYYCKGLKPFRSLSRTFVQIK